MGRPMQRRQFLSLSAATGMSLLAGRAPAGSAKAPDTAGYIDAHVHVWSSDTDRYPLAPGQTKAHMNPPAFTPEDLFPHMRQAGVGRVNLIQMSYYGTDNSYMTDMMAKFPDTFSGTAIVDPLGDDPAGAMRALAEQKCYSFRIQPAMSKEPPERWLQPAGMDAMFKAASKEQLALCPLIRVDALPELDRMCTKYPEAPVVIDHLCLIDTVNRLEEDLAALNAMARHRQVHVKIGAFYALGKRSAPYTDLLPAIKRVVDAFTPERCMWESDAPFQIAAHRYEDSVALIRDHADFLSGEDKNRILGGTAARVFFREYLE